MCGALLALSGLIPNAFTSDDAVLDQIAIAWPLFAAVLPFAAIVFALDGILIGAGDTRFIALAMALAAAVSIAVQLATLAFGWGIAGVWAAMAALMAVRLATMGARFAGPEWAVTGARLEEAAIS
jgi:Na+-driven multidrug efflux pump